jgi:hypothetical protein
MDAAVKCRAGIDLFSIGHGGVLGSGGRRDGNDSWSL